MGRLYMRSRDQFDKTLCLRKTGQEYGRIIFLVSDTEAGKQTGEALIAYFGNCKEKFGLQKNRVSAVSKIFKMLAPGDFRTKGLRNLVREIEIFIKK